MFEGGGDGFQGVVTSEFKGAVDGHQNGLSLGPLLGSVSVRVFANDDRGADLAFAVIMPTAGLCRVWVSGLGFECDSRIFPLVDAA